jgi:hypothetical protein
VGIGRHGAVVVVRVGARAAVVVAAVAVTSTVTVAVAVVVAVARAGAVVGSLVDSAQICVKARGSPPRIIKAIAHDAWWRGVQLASCILHQPHSSFVVGGYKARHLERLAAHRDSLSQSAFIAEAHPAEIAHPFGSNRPLGLAMGPRFGQALLAIPQSRVPPFLLPP